MEFSNVWIKIFFGTTVGFMCPPQALAGGATGVGGGGNVSPETHSTQDQVKGLLPANVFELFVWLNHYEIMIRGTHLLVPEPVKLLFRNRSESNLALIKRLFKRIEYRTDRYCTNENLHRDGAYLPDQSLPICLSGLGISEHARADLLPEELFGLLAHETAHAVGANEEEALAIQKIAKKDYRRFDVEWDPDLQASAPRFYWNRTIDQLFSAIDQLKENRSLAEVQIGCYMADDYINTVEVTHGMANDKFSSLDFESQKAFNDYFINFKNAMMYSCAKRSRPSSDEVVTRLARQYVQVFLFSTELSSLSIVAEDDPLNRANLGPVLAYAKESRIRRIENEADLAAATGIAQRSLATVRSYLAEARGISMELVSIP